MSTPFRARSHAPGDSAAAHTGTGTATGTGQRSLLPAVAWGPLAMLALGSIAVALLVGTRYGYHRDELYFLAAGRRLAWGYVDQPPFTPAVARLAWEVFGNSLPGLRVFPALAGAATLVMVGLIAREFGGGRFAQVLAAGGAALVPLFHTPAMVLSTTTFDLLFWAICLWLVARLLRTGDDRLWLAVGAVAGVGLLNKHAVVYLGLGLAVGFLVTSRRTLLLRPTAVAGAAIALLLWLPNLWWHSQHDWPVIEMSRSLQAENGGVQNLLLFAPGLLVLVGFVSVVVWGPGLWWLLRSTEGRMFRPLGAMVVVVTAVVAFLGSKPYYLASLFIVLFAAGAVTIATRQLAVRRLAVAGAVTAGVVTLPASVPVLPAAWLGPVLSMNGEFGEMYGWPELTDQVTSAYRRLAPQERARTVVLAANYGEYGALEHYGSGRGLPQAYSGHNNAWWWGPPPADATTVIAIGLPPSQLRRWFTSVEPIATVTNPAGLANEESGQPIVVARGPVRPWADLWPELRHYG
jgi:hypothetical protein